MIQGSGKKIGCIVTHETKNLLVITFHFSLKHHTVLNLTIYNNVCSNTFCGTIVAGFLDVRGRRAPGALYPHGSKRSSWRRRARAASRSPAVGPGSFCRTSTRPGAAECRPRSSSRGAPRALDRPLSGSKVIYLKTILLFKFKKNFPEQRIFWNARVTFMRAGSAFRAMAVCKAVLPNLRSPDVESAPISRSNLVVPSDTILVFLSIVSCASTAMWSGVLPVTTIGR